MIRGGFSLIEASAIRPMARIEYRRVPKPVCVFP